MISPKQSSPLLCDRPGRVTANE